MSGSLPSSKRSRGPARRARARRQRRRPRGLARGQVQPDDDGDGGLALEAAELRPEAAGRSLTPGAAARRPARSRPGSRRRSEASASPAPRARARAPPAGRRRCRARCASSGYSTLSPTGWAATATAGAARRRRERAPRREPRATPRCPGSASSAAATASASAPASAAVARHAVGGARRRVAADAVDLREQLLRARAGEHAQARQPVGILARARPARHDRGRAAEAGRLDRRDHGGVVVARGVAEPVGVHVVESADALRARPRPGSAARSASSVIRSAWS